MYSSEIFSSDTITRVQWQDLCNFIKKQAVEWPAHPAIINMSETNNAGLLYNIKNKKRWNAANGEIAIVRYQNDVIAVSAVEKSSLHNHLCIGGIRCWIDSKHRTKNIASKYLLDSNLNYAKNHNMWAMMLTFNEYNKDLYLAICRKIDKKTVGFANTWSNWWNDCIIVPKVLEIRYTLQWCILKPINQHGTEIILETLSKE